MKKIILLLTVLFILFNSSTICASTDSPDSVKIDSLVKNIKELKKQNQELKVLIDTVTVRQVKILKLSKNNVELDWNQFFIVWMPVILFVFLFWFLMKRLRMEGFKLSEALSSCNPVEDKTPLPAVNGANAPNPPAEPVPNKEPKLLNSSSRLIAFMSGLTAIVISITLMTFYFYDVIAKVDINSAYLDSVWKVVAALGIGIIPYGFNMLKEAQK